MIELILANESVLVLARSGGAGSAALDDVARRVGALLKQPIQLGRGMLIADPLGVCVQRANSPHARAAPHLLLGGNLTRFRDVVILSV